MSTELKLIDISACCAAGLAAPLDRAEAEQLAKVLKAVAEPARLQLLSLIRSAGEACACDLNDPVGLSQPTVSHHLKVLADAGLIVREQRGQWAWFRADESRIRDLGRLFG
jgi:ArsR family transcriptional regulator